MSTTVFLLEKTGEFLEELPNKVREMVEGYNRWEAGNPNHGPGKDFDFKIATYEEVINESIDASNVVPVGCIDFCTAVANAQGCPQITALNIPMELRCDEFLHRSVFDVADIHELKQLLKMNDMMFVKPGDRVKRFNPIAVSEDGADVFLYDFPGPYFVSEVIDSDIVGEWRVFFYRGRIVGARPYIFRRWKAPNDKLVQKMLSTWTTAPTAGTLDIGILANGKNVLIEAHQFIACGLYGYEDPTILRMLRDAWKWQLEQPKQA